MQTLRVVGTLSRGTRIGAHQVECELGSTRTGALYEVVHIVLPRRGLLKVAHSSPLGVQLLREACLVTAIQHPGMPTVLDSGMLADGRPWFATERIEGESLAEMVIDVVETPAAPVPMPMPIGKPRWTPPMAFTAVNAPKDDEFEIDLEEVWN